MSPLPIAAALALLLLGGLLLIAVSVMPPGKRSALAERVDRALGASADASSPPDRHPVPAWRSGLERRCRSVFTFRLARSWGVRTATSTLVSIGLGAAAGGGVLSYGVLHLPLWAAALAAAGLFVFVPRFLAMRAQLRVEAQFAELLPDTVDMIVRMIRAGLPVAAAISAVGEQAMPPMSTVFREIADEIGIGIPLEEALAASGERVGVADYRYLVVAVALQRSTGGNLAATLETLSEILRKRRSVRLKAKAASAEVRISAMVLGAIPFFVVGALALVSPGYLAPLIYDPRGNILAGMALVNLALGGITMRWMIRRSLAG